jgi:HK97 family phage major capsid protein
MAVAINDTEEGRRLIGEFQDSIKEFRAWVTKSQDEFKQYGSVQSATQEQVTTLSKQVGDVMTQMKEMAESKSKTDEELKRLRQIGFRLGAAGAAGGDGAALTLGERFTQSDAYKNSQFSGRFRVASAISGRLLERKATVITEPGSGIVIYPQRVGFFLTPPQLPLVMRDLLNVIPLSGTNAVEYVKETWTYGADYQLNEGDIKASGNVVYTDATAVVRTIAWYVKISRQMLSDVPYIAQTIDQRLLYGVLRKEEHEILWGTGAAGHLNGIMTQAPAMNTTTPPLGTAPYYKLDYIIEAITYLSSMGYVPDACILNPLDWGSMLWAKDSSERYLLAPWGGLASVPATLWGVRMVQSVEMTQGTLLTGAFSGNAALFDRETANVELSYENEDDFIRNLATIRAEERVALAVFIPQAFVKSDISTGKLAIEGTNGGTQPAPAPAHTSHTAKK